MIKLLLLCWPLLLLSGIAHAQRRPLATLPPRVVSLDSGQILRRPLVGIDLAAYAQLRQERATDLQVHRLDSLSLAVASREITRLQGEVAATYELLRQKSEDYQKLKAKRAPFLPTYSAGFGSGFLAGLLAGFRFSPK